VSISKKGSSFTNVFQYFKVKYMLSCIFTCNGEQRWLLDRAETKSIIQSRSKR